MLGLGVEEREVKRRTVCCNRDIAQTGTTACVDQGSEFERRAARIGEGEHEVCLDWLVQLEREMTRAGTASDGSQQLSAAITVHCLQYGRPVLL